MTKKTNPSDTILSTLEIIGNIACSEGGLTKREYFAVMAMQGLLSVNPAEYKYDTSLLKNAVTCADYLIKELNK